MLGFLHLQAKFGMRMRRSEPQGKGTGLALGIPYLPDLGRWRSSRYNALISSPIWKNKFLIWEKGSRIPGESQRPNVRRIQSRTPRRDLGFTSREAQAVGSHQSRPTAWRSGT